MFDFFKFQNNHRGTIKAGAIGAFIGVTSYLLQTINNNEDVLPATAVFIGISALNLYLCAIPTPNVTYKEFQPGTNGEDNGFYLVEDNSLRLGM